MRKIAKREVSKNHIAEKKASTKKGGPLPEEGQSFYAPSAPEADLTEPPSPPNS
jgi:hypothetical protein